MDFYQEFLREIKKQNHSDKQLAKLKRSLALKYKLNQVPTNIEILLNCPEKEINLFKHKLLTKPTRTIAGVAPVAIMTKPAPCPHGKCAYCMGGVNSYFGDVPQSYTGKEPATMRGIRNRYDSYLQVFNRLEQYLLLGHVIDKVELIIMGGTFPSLPQSYQEEFTWGAFKAMNDFSKLFFNKEGLDFIKFKQFFELPAVDLQDKKRTERIQLKLAKIKGIFQEKELAKEQQINETAKIRCVALCLETRPDYCGEKEIKEMLKLGCTRVELGVQHLDDKILKQIERGHGVKETIQATKKLKNYFLKVGYHVMPGLPGSSITKDQKMLKQLFTDQNLRPDALKIYPCMVAPGTKVYDWFKAGTFQPLTTEKAAKLIAEFKETVPEYVRILRVQRDIPTYQITAGVDMTNLRQYLTQKYQPKCRCIRCREPKNQNLDLKSTELKIKKYLASQGEEYFISIEEPKKDLLLGFCRLRIFNKQAGIRELHVYGTATGIGEEGNIQHRGLGKKLLGAAEKIVQKNKIKTILVISGIGVKEYYQKLGYFKEGYYMRKDLS